MHTSLSSSFLGEFPRFFVRVKAVHAAEGCLFAINHFTVTSFVHLAAAMGANVEAGLNGDGNQISKAFEKPSAELSAFLSEFENFSFLLAHRLDSMLYQALFFQLLQKRVDEAWAHFFFYSLFEVTNYLIPVGGSFVKYGKYVEA